MPQMVDPAFVSIINARSYAALKAARRNAGNTAYEFATGAWLDTANAFAVIPTCPTATLGDNSTKVATTAFVLANTSSVSGANPSASVGLSAVNGSASTFLRSDGAPALSQAIVPTWTGLHTFQAQTSAKAAVFKAAATTPDNILECQNSSGTVLARITKDGYFSNVTTPSVGYANMVEGGYLIAGYGQGFISKTSGGSETTMLRITTVGGLDTTQYYMGSQGQMLLSNTAFITFADQGGSTPVMLLSNTVGGVGAKLLAVRAAASRTAQLQQFQTSAGDSLGNVSGGCIGDVFADVSTTHTDGTADTLRTDTLVANALIVNGDKVYFDYTLTVVTHTTNTAEFKLTLAGITIFDSGALTFAATGTVRIFGYIIRKTSTTARATINFAPSGSSTILGYASTNYVSDATLTGLTLTSTNALVLSAAAAGTGAASGDIALVSATIHIDGFGS